MGTYSKILAVSLLSLHIAGCATARKMTTPDGNEGYYIKCDGTAVSMDVCYRKASDLCPNGYKIIDKNNESGVVINPYTIGSTSKKGIFVECKTAE